MNHLNTSNSMIKLAMTFALSVVVMGCDSDSQSENTAPIVTLATEMSEVMQSARASLYATVTDKEHNLASVEWTLLSAPSGATVKIEGNATQQAYFLAPNTLGEYKFSLLAKDDKGGETRKEMIVNVVDMETYLTPKLNKIANDIFQANQAETANMAFNVAFNGFGFNWQSAHGLADVSEQTAMTTEHAFRIASISKTITVATALRMIEQGYFSLETPIGELLTDGDLPRNYSVADLHIRDDVKRGEAITIRQLMDQSSGIPDFISYLRDPEAPGTMEVSGSLSGEASTTPELWTPERILSNILDRGLTQNLDSMPGERHIYGNSNTDILGVILEKVGNAPLHELMAEHILIPLGMSSTFMEHHQDSATTPVDHFYQVAEADYGDTLASHMYGNHNMIELAVNTSFAWAGGGLVSTLTDLDRFFAAIQNETLLENQQLKAEWRDWKIQNGDEQYGLGIAMGSFKIGGADHEYKYRGHSGAWGATAFNIEPIDVRIITWVGQAMSDADFEFNYRVISLLDDIGFQYDAF